MLKSVLENYLWDHDSCSKVRVVVHDIRREWYAIALTVFVIPVRTVRFLQEASGAVLIFSVTIVASSAMAADPPEECNLQSFFARHGTIKWLCRVTLVEKIVWYDGVVINVAMKRLLPSKCCYEKVTQSQRRAIKQCCGTSLRCTVVWLLAKHQKPSPFSNFWMKWSWKWLRFKCSNFLLWSKKPLTWCINKRSIKSHSVIPHQASFE